MIDRVRIKGAKIPELAAIEVIRDIDSAIARRDLVSLRAFAREAELSGMDQEAARAFEIARLLEMETKAGRDELTKIKAALRPPPPSQAELVRRFDAWAMGNTGSGFSEDLEHRRAVHENARLAEFNRRSEEERRRQVGQDEQEPWWRR